MLSEEQRRWYAEHGTPQEKQFVRKYGRTRVTANGLSLSVAWYLLVFFCVIVLPACALLYVGRLRAMHPVTGSWVGFLTNSTGTDYRRAVYLKTYINPLAWRRPTLAGQAVMCDDGGGMRFDMKTRTVSGDTLGLVLSATKAQESGELFAVLQGSELRAQYDGSDPALSGVLHRGELQDFQQVCSQMRR